jgi:phosphoesterase RecJ-like protein
MDFANGEMPAFSNLLKTARNITIITHYNPDGDAIGSATGLGQALAQLGKHVTIRCDDPTPDYLTFIPWADKIVFPDEICAADLIIAVDCGDESRMGKSFELFASPLPPIVNIDHHRTNTNFGVVNIVAEKATSTAEMLTHILPALGATIDQNIAISLLTGLVTDSLGFRISSVTPETVKAGSLLMEAGAELSEIMDKALNIHPLTTLKLYGLGLNHLNFKDGFLWCAIPYSEREKLGSDVTGSGGLVSMLGYTAEANMGAVLSEMENGEVRVSFRSRPPFDVALVAEHFGGGGHRQAAGCRLTEMSLAEAEALVVARATAEIARQTTT